MVDICIHKKSNFQSHGKSADTEVKNLLQEQRDLGVLPFHANQDIENLDHSKHVAETVNLVVQKEDTYVIDLPGLKIIFLIYFQYNFVNYLQQNMIQLFK